MTTEEARKKIETEPDFIYLKRFDYSLDRLIERYPDGAPNRVIAQALMMTEDDVEETFNSIIAKLRGTLENEET
jgi:hypothetical protein